MKSDQFLESMRASVQEIAETMMFVEITPGTSQHRHFSLSVDFMATISFGQGLRGGFCLAAPDATALKLSMALLMEEREEMDAELSDAFGELANMIAGGVQVRVEPLLGAISMAPPVITAGSNLKIFYNASFACVSQNFELEGIAFVTEIFFLKDALPQ